LVHFYHCYYIIKHSKTENSLTDESDKEAKSNSCEDETRMPDSVLLNQRQTQEEEDDRVTSGTGIGTQQILSRYTSQSQRN